MTDAIGRFLDSDMVNAQTDDDKMLILAALRQFSFRRSGNAWLKWKSHLSP
jgi:hypothetical protein